MNDTLDLSLWYGAHYFRSYRGAPYERSALWLGVMQAMADGIVRELGQPRTVLDVGCAIGLLVEALRDRGVEAFGLDHSPYAIDRVDERIKPFCWVASVLDPLPARYDAIVCHEVIEHLPPADADAAVARICAATDDVLFSSTPDGYDEDTHLNVQPVDYWASLFARHGFLRDLSFNPAGFLAPWACRFRRVAQPLHRTVEGYEQRVWTLWRENTSLRSRVMAQAATIGRLEQAALERPETAPLERTIEEQKEHLDALTERIAYMTDREADLRRLLLDAHDQLLRRDQMLQARVPPAVVEDLRALVDERTAWAQRAVEDLDAARASAGALQVTIDERTAWAQLAVEEVEHARAVIAELRTVLDERTAWAQRAASEAEQARAAIAVLHAAVDERTAWAQRAVADLEQAHAVTRDLRALVDERTAWAQRAVAEIDDARARAEALQAAVDEQTRTADAHAKTIAVMTASRVWRAGAPVRRMRRLLTGSR